MKKWQIIGIAVLCLLLALELAYAFSTGAFGGDGKPEVTALPVSTASPTPEPEPTPSPTPLPLPDEEDMWQLAIASADYPLPAEYPVNTVTVEGYLFDERAAAALVNLLAAARADGMDLLITSAWRSRETQAALYENRVYRFQLEGYSREEAEVTGATVVAKPGTSEHELGLSIDFITGSYTSLDEGFAGLPEYQWLQEHCAEFGFVERYPNGKGDITGIIWEPWHYRYVGVECAEYIMSHGICLEEFLSEAGLLPA